MKYLIAVAAVLLTAKVYADTLYTNPDEPNVNAWSPYAEAIGGFSALSDNAHPGSLVGVRLGGKIRQAEIGLSYQRNDAEVDSPILSPGYLTTHIINLEFKRFCKLSNSLDISFGVAGGYAVPELDSNVTETIEPGLDGIFSTGLNFNVTESLSAGLTASYFVFHAKTHRTDYVVGTDTVLSGGVPIGTVETVDAAESDNSLNFNSLLIAVGLKYKF